MGIVDEVRRGFSVFEEEVRRFYGSGRRRGVGSVVKFFGGR